MKKIKSKIMNMNPKKGFLKIVVIMIVFIVVAGIGLVVNFGGRISEWKQEIKTQEQKYENSENTTEVVTNEKQDKHKKENHKNKKDIDIEDVITLETTDYVILGIIGGIACVLMAIYWLYTVAYAVSKSWKVSANPWIFGLLTLFTNLIGIVILMVYIELHNTCPKCGKLSSKKANNCSACGTAIYVNCPQCEKRIKSADRYCSGCGNKMK